MWRWTMGGLHREVSEANETKQATQKPPTAICDFVYFKLIFPYGASNNISLNQ